MDYPSINSAKSNIKYISSDAHPELIDYLRSSGYSLSFVESNGIVDDAIRKHPDIFMCRLGITQDSPIVFATKDGLGPTYPEDVKYNAACTGKFFIHNLSYSAPELLEAAKSMGMQLIDVKQGYAKCSIVIVDEDSIITYDEGIACACEDAGMNVLRIQPGHVILPGYSRGFIGGATGLLDGELVFNGNLSQHPDYLAIQVFTGFRGVSCKYFEDYPLTDIGSII